MDIRRLTENYAVSPQISVDDLPVLKAEGFAGVICNRPDAEAEAGDRAAAIRAAAEAENMSFLDNPITHGAMTPEKVALQRQAIAEAGGPVLAYCASGTRSTVIWMLGEAPDTDPEALLSAARSHGYDLDMLRPQLTALHRP